MTCLRKVKTANAWFQNGTFTGFLAFEMNSSPIHVYNTIQVPSFCTVFSFYLPFFKALSPFLALVTISKYVLPDLGSTYLPSHISSGETIWEARRRWTILSSARPSSLQARSPCCGRKYRFVRPCSGHPPDRKRS